MAEHVNFNIPIPGPGNAAWLNGKIKNISKWKLAIFSTIPIIRNSSQSPVCILKADTNIVETFHMFHHMMYQDLLTFIKYCRKCQTVLNKPCSQPEYYKRQKDPWWEQYMEYSWKIEKDLSIWCWVWMKSYISWLWQTVFVGVVMCWGETMVICWEGH